LANLETMDHAILVHFHQVDGLVQPVWVDVGGPVTGDGTWKDVVDPAVGPARIYRILGFWE
jgi:hypothetical protein